MTTIHFSFGMPVKTFKTKPPVIVPPWSTNDAGRLHFMERNKRIQAWRKAAHWAAMMYDFESLPLEPSFVRCTLPFWTNQSRDPSNYMGTCHKAIVDGLVDAGLWEDDTPEFVTGIEPICHVMPKADRIVTVTITPRSEGLHL